MMTEPVRRVAVIGGGITGAVVAEHLSHALDDGLLDRVVVFERDQRVGGRALTTPFAGIDHVDCGPDAFLSRVPEATALAHQVGLGDELVHPEPVGAAVWHRRLHAIPSGLVLGVPGDLGALARSRLLSWPGKARAAFEPLLPRSPIDHDSIGRHVRSRFGREVHERLVDALVGSIYATDTDRFSLAEMPQVASLAEGRSMLLTARRIAAANPGTATAQAAPIFAVPRSGVGRLVTATMDAATERGVWLRTGSDPTIARLHDELSWRVDDEPFDAVVLATPAQASRELLAEIVPETALGLSTAETADVALVTLHVDDAEFPEQCLGLSGYLVPKPVQQAVTAVSFGSQKWAHWRPPSGGQVLRVSLGRDGAPVLHLSDDQIVDRMLADLRRHLDVEFTPRDVRVSRWPGAFAQYRPHHRQWVEDVRQTLPPGLFLAGSSYDGIGLPACIRSGKTIAERVLQPDVGVAS
ncbi:MAG: NAD(P)/FAD-dependent oxidoreductase [Ilumatobacter sp.]